MTGVDLPTAPSRAPMPRTPKPSAPGHSRSRSRWLVAWTMQRFPPRNGVFFAVLYATAALVARAAATPGAVAIGWGDVPGFLALWAFFLLLRVFDEHKDFAADAVAHPERVLQRGLITLRDLDAVGAAAVALQLGVSLWHDRGVGPATAWWLASIAWSLLMAREFFASRWLRARLVWYALSHMLIMPLLVLWVMAMASPAAVDLSTPAARAPVALTAALAFAAGLAVEVARKVRGPEDERPMADSYTGALGVRGAVWLLLGATLATAVLAEWLATRLGGGARVTLPSVALGVGCAVAASAAMSFARAPNGVRARRVEAATAIVVLLAHLLVLATLLGTPAVVRA